MATVANDPAAAKRLAIPQKVGKEFMQADKGTKFGGSPKTRSDRQVLNRQKTRQGASEFFKDGGQMKESKAMMGKEIAFMKKKGAPKSMIKHEMAEAKGMKKMASGGYTRAADGIASKGKTKAKQVKMAYGGKC
jgi:hypothetical protein